MHTPHHNPSLSGIVFLKERQHIIILLRKLIRRVSLFGSIRTPLRQPKNNSPTLLRHPHNQFLINIIRILHLKVSNLRHTLHPLQKPIQPPRMRRPHGTNVTFSRIAHRATIRMIAPILQHLHLRNTPREHPARRVRFAPSKTVLHKASERRFFDASVANVVRRTASGGLPAGVKRGGDAGCFPVPVVEDVGIGDVYGGV
mmetsp:Transcript_1499/g.1913  ORF Transcript_1499/g.1913 Transcript_1499/m.1913 type:complete len:200 (+) Transcript_1499:316-915(+)